MSDRMKAFARDFRFWVRIMQEHALFIRIGAPNDRPDIIAEAQGFFELFTRLRQAAEAGPITRNLIIETREATIALLGFKRRLLALAVQCRTVGGTNYPLLLDHIAREAVEFLRVIDCTVTHPAPGPFRQVLEQEVFWLKIMADHSKFIRHLLDPSERKFTKVAEKFSVTFDELFLHAWELRSMTQACPEMFPTVGRFTEQVIDRTRELRDFKAQARELIAGCRILGLIPEDLADHVTREAEHFITILGDIQNTL